MLSLCGLFSDDFLKCLYLKQLCKIIMLCFQKIVSENSVKIPTRQNLIREVVTSQDHAWWPGYHVGGAITCQGAGRGASCVMSFILYIQGCEFQGSTFNFPRTLTWRVHPHLPVMVLRERCLITCLICPPVFSAHVCHPEKDVALPAIPSASCISSSSSL